MGGWQPDASQADLGRRPGRGAVLGAEGVGLGPCAAAACAGTCTRARARAARPGVGKMMASWAHQAAAQVTGRLKSVLWLCALSSACCC